MEEVQELVIDRAKWRTGRYNRGDKRVGPTKLLNAEGFQCCLGFYLEEAGISRQVLSEKIYPQDVARRGIDLGWLVRESGLDSEAAEALISSNDGGMGDAQREAEVARLFAEQGTEVEFIGEYPEVTE